MRALFPALLFVGLVACPHPAPQPVETPGPPPTCSVASPRTEDVCDGLFTADGYACVRCPGAKGCIDAVDGVYCATGPCAEDARCKARRP